MVPRISRIISSVVSGWRKAKRATVSPSQVVGVTKPGLVRQQPGRPGLVVGFAPARPAEEHDGELGLAAPVRCGASPQ